MASSLGIMMSTERAQIEAYLPVPTSCYSDFDERNWYVGGKYLAQLHVASNTAEKRRLVDWLK